MSLTRTMNLIKNIDEFENKNWRSVSPGSFHPSDAPQAYLTTLKDSVEVPLYDLAVGATFYYQSYPSSYPGKYYKFEKDRKDRKGQVCTWLSDDGKFMMNKHEDTYCFSIYDTETKVYVLLDEKQRSFSPDPGEDDEPMDFSLKSFDASGLSVSSNDRIADLEKQVAILTEETNWLKQQLHKFYITNQ